MFNRTERITYDLFLLMAYMEDQGFMSMKRYWKEYVLESYNISNDIYVEMCFYEGIDEETNEYHEEVRRLLNLGYEDNVLMKVTW